MRGNVYHAVLVLLCVVCLSVLGVASASLLPDEVQAAGQQPQGQESSGQHRYVKDQVDKALVPLYDMANFFVNSMVHTRVFTWLRDNKGANLTTPESTFEHMKDHWEDWVLYWIGFAVCAGVGVVLFITMILVALIVPCCRCCGNCGGKINPKEPKDAKCQRIGCGITLFLITCIMILGVVCMFTLNIRLNQSLVGDESIMDHLGDTMTDLDSFMHDTADEINEVALTGFQNTKDEVFLMLDDIPSESVGTVDNATAVFTNFRRLAKFVDDLPALNSSLVVTDSHLDQLNIMHSDFNDTLTDIADSLLPGISSCTEIPCIEMVNRLTYLTTQGNFENISNNVQAAMYAVMGLLANEDLINEIQNVNTSLEDIESNIENVIADPINEAKEFADNLEGEIKTFVEDIEDQIEGLPLGSLKDTFDNIKENDLQLPALITYWSIFGLAAILGLICLCNLIGLLHDLACPRRRPDADCCSTDKSMGADWLLVGVGFTFIFYWFYTLLVLVFFLAGGAVESEGCRHLVNYNNTKSAEVLNIYDEWIEQRWTPDIYAIQGYKNCEQNMAVYTAFNLEELYNITQLLNLTEVEKAIGEIKDVDIDIGTINVITDKLVEILEPLDSALRLDFESYNAELDKELTNEDLDRLVDDLYKLSNESGIDNETLMVQIGRLQVLILDVPGIEDNKSSVKEGLKTTEDILGSFTIADIFSALNESEEALNSNGNTVIGQFVNGTADGVFGQIKSFAEDTEHKVRYSVGACFPVYESLTDTIDAGCVQALWPINGFWFSLGWIIFFLIPSLIFSFKLATLYRKTLPYKSKSDREDELARPLYQEDAYKGPEAYGSSGGGPAMMMTNMHGHGPAAGPSSRDMYAADNPVYHGDDENPKFLLPRPQMIQTSPHHNAPVHSTHAQSGYPPKYSPPPGYKEQWPQQLEKYPDTKF